MERKTRKRAKRGWIIFVSKFLFDLIVKVKLVRFFSDGHYLLYASDCISRKYEEFDDAEY
jgi:hypothetical protein